VKIVSLADALPSEIADSCLAQATPREVPRPATTAELESQLRADGETLREIVAGVARLEQQLDDARATIKARQHGYFTPDEDDRVRQMLPTRSMPCAEFKRVGGPLRISPPTPNWITLMADVWYRGFHRFCNWVYFARIAVVDPERLPKSGPVLYLGLHRNGAVDGFVYHSLLPRAVFMISTQLRKNPLGKIFFTGIEVARSKDEGDKSVNADALRQCVELLRAGGELFVFPEGTSSLGPRHLQFKSGAAQLLADYLAGGRTIQVVPLGIHYERAWSFRAKVEVVVGEPVAVDLPQTFTPLGRLKELKRRMTAALESVGVNVESEQYQETIQRLAYSATLGTPRSYFKTLKALEHSIPEKILTAWQVLEPELARRRPLTHQGLPLFPMGPVWLYVLALLVLGPLVLAGVIMNLPPFLAAWWAGKKFPDDRNVISLWKILVGLPLFVIWVLLLAAVAVAAGKLAWFGVYGLTTVVALKLYYRVKKLAVATQNGLRHPALRPRVLAFRELVLRELPDEE
jgi:1-acyl-sn-glycerol-3-phosphate acyltransferase